MALALVALTVHNKDAVATCVLHLAYRSSLLVECQSCKPFRFESFIQALQMHPCSPATFVSDPQQQVLPPVSLPLYCASIQSQADWDCLAAESGFLLLRQAKSFCLTALLSICHAQLAVLPCYSAASVVLPWYLAIQLAVLPCYSAASGVLPCHLAVELAVLPCYSAASCDHVWLDVDLQDMAKHADGVLCDTH